MSGKGRRARRAVLRRQDPHAGAPSAVALGCLAQLLGMPGTSGRPPPRVHLKQWLPLIRGACSAVGGQLVLLRTEGQDSAWCVLAGRSVFRFRSLREVCHWVLGEIAARKSLPLAQVDVYSVRLAWVAG